MTPTQAQIDAAAKAIHGWELKEGIATRGWGAENDTPFYKQMAEAALTAAAEVEKFSPPITEAQIEAAAIALYGDKERKPSDRSMAMAEAALIAAAEVGVKDDDGFTTGLYPEQKEALAAAEAGCPECKKWENRYVFAKNIYKSEIVDTIERCAQKLDELARAAETDNDDEEINVRTDAFAEAAAAIRAMKQ